MTSTHPITFGGHKKEGRSYSSTGTRIASFAKIEALCLDFIIEISCDGYLVEQRQNECMCGRL